MPLTWSDDPARLNKCWDLRNERGQLIAYVLKVDLRYAASGFEMSFPSRWFDTKEDAVAHIEALIALES